MPNRHYIPSGGEWPGWVDHLFAHLHEVGLAIITTLFGVLFLVGALHPTYNASVLLQQFSPIHELTIAIPLVIGGPTVVIASLVNYRRRATYWLLLRLGVLLEALGWAGYSAALLLLQVGATVSGVFSMGLTALLVVRLFRTFVDERRIRHLGRQALHQFGGKDFQ